MTKTRFLLGLALSLASFACSAGDEAPAASAAAAADFIEGRVVDGAGAPQAGGWGIAETATLPTPYRKIVVTNDDGRFVVPELPDASYDVWARGYGLADSTKTAAGLGAQVELVALAAESPQHAAAIYPASYWLSLFHLPGEDPAAWANQFKLGCELCHQVGSIPTRNKTAELYDTGLRKARVMHATADGLGRAQLLAALADWSARIQAGEVPEAPPRPAGVERNLVITQWAWGDGTTYAHDEIATDKRDVTVNASGPIYGVDIGNDHTLVLDPRTHAAA